MKFKSDSIIIRELLNNNKFKIPRYQREYSWTKDQLEDFYNDIIGNIKYDEKGYSPQEYFFGTIILVGEMSQIKNAIEIIDGQQRITTITIFLSVLSSIMSQEDEGLANIIWKYVIGRDDNGEKYSVLENETAHPYFQRKIQDSYIPKDTSFTENISCDHKDLREMEENLSSECECIRCAYEFFKDKLEEKSLSAPVFVNGAGSRLDKLKVVRDQLLGSTFIYIISESIDDVNKIFENINSKGLRLSSIDLIKNEIFSTENGTVPLDKAKEAWNAIKSNLVIEDEYISMQKFYRYFWISRYSNCTEKDLYGAFKKSVGKNEYLEFLGKMKEASEVFSNVAKPKEKYFQKSSNGNNVQKCDLASFISSLNYIQDTFNIEQVQILLIVLVEKYKQKKIKFKQLRGTVKFLEEFHFIYNGILTKRANALASIYGKFAREIYKLETASEINLQLSNLKKELAKKIPIENQEFIDNFCQLQYSSDNSVSRSKARMKKNLIAKYAIYKYEEILCGQNNTRFDHKDSTITIEHVFPESEVCGLDDLELSIGNLIILERDINNECGTKMPSEKRELYEGSRFYVAKKFLQDFSEFSDSSINERASNMAKEIFDHLTASWKKS